MITTAGLEFPNAPAAPAVLAAPSGPGGAEGTRDGGRRPGRPLEMTTDELLSRLRQLAEEPWGLFRAHRAHPALYARARRLFGSWSAALHAAGIRYDLLRAAARARSIQTRAQRRRPGPPGPAPAPRPGAGPAPPIKPGSGDP